MYKYASVNYAITDSSNDLAPSRQQSIIWTIAFENVVCQTSAILS